MRQAPSASGHDGPATTGAPSRRSAKAVALAAAEPFAEEAAIGGGRLKEKSHSDPTRSARFRRGFCIPARAGNGQCRTGRLARPGRRPRIKVKRNRETTATVLLQRPIFYKGVGRAKTDFNATGIGCAGLRDQHAGCLQHNGRGRPRHIGDRPCRNGYRRSRKEQDVTWRCT